MSRHRPLLRMAFGLSVLCVSCRNTGPVAVMGPGGHGMVPFLAVDAPENAEAWYADRRESVNPLLQRSFPGWIETSPFTFREFLHVRHPEMAPEGSILWEFETKEEEDAYAKTLAEARLVYDSLFEPKGTGYRLRIDESGPEPRIAWSREAAPPPAELPFETALRNPFYAHADPEHRVEVGKVLKVEDGWLVCHDDGEFGAWLYWYDNDGNNAYEVLPFAWVQGFFRFGEKLFVLEGCDIWDDEAGQVFELVRTNGRWHPVSRGKLPQTPRLVTPMTDTSFLVVCSTSLVEVSTDGSVQCLYGLINTGYAKLDFLEECGTWYLHKPRSAVVHKGNVYIGTSFGVVVVQLRGWRSREEWLVPWDRLAPVSRYFRIGAFPLGIIPTPEPQAMPTEEAGD